MATSTASQSIDPSLGTVRGFYNCPETPNPVALPITGQLPDWLEGVLYRTGPGTFDVPTNKARGGQLVIRHWFDGLSLNHRFEIKDGQVIYRSKRGAVMVEEHIQQTGSYPKSGSFGQADPCEHLLGKFFTKFRQSPPPKGKSAVNVSVTLTPHFNGFSLDGDLIAKTDSNVVQILDRVTLEPIRLRSYSSISKELDGPLSAAHAGVDDGEFYNFTLSFTPKPVYKVFKIDAQGQVTVLAKITDAPAAYIHTVFLTKRFVVLAVWQADFKLGGMPIFLGGAMSVNTFKQWSDKRKTLFFVVDRKSGGVVARYQADPFFAFHALNSYDDEDGSVVLDIACYEDNSIISDLTLEKLRAMGSHPTKPYITPTSARRFRLENIPSSPYPPTGAFLEAKLELDLGVSCNIELPNVAPAVANKPYRYTYGIHTYRDNDHEMATSLANSIIKLDMRTATSKVWKDPHHVPGEPIFIARPAGEGSGTLGEDAGVLLTIALDASKGSSALVVIDAETMTEVARATLIVPFPFGFHGAFTSKM